MSPPIGVLLAAGSSRRFGANKLLQPMAGGEPMGVMAARHLLTAVSRGVAVVRPDDVELSTALSELGYRVVENLQPESGMGESLAVAVTASLDAGGWLVALGDMPWIKPQTIAKVAERLAKGASLVAPVYKGERGHPVGFATRWGERLVELNGDRGARQLLIDYPNDLELLPVDDPGILLDVDFPEQLAEAGFESLSGNEFHR
ncbi:MAG: nucleotidyltransferase family protein [Candidatus Thiodiazotropha taylori]|nr:nucleotidyltransferase family protein [Candidatus Thiodiazotropha taylori]MCG8035942.1 nucleotidyltransferase family protein [Candidatus Thiodiazotropha taylori]MCG8108923.1 nucleotidyltransferase family protein [Candidatus Thiodiazotropha taylori]MCG8112761.1 nucleotidyltransferase family protein [Candidatus Thiodiazotropha taylori]MCW4281259.1 nucleotidyltransferase family protein [Candidatus Thiodiazotropha taylori]